MITIGRAGLGWQNGLVVSSFSVDGDSLKVDGWIRDQDSLDDVLALRDQLTGYPNVDEAVVPVLWDEQPEVNGFYRVLSTSVGSEPRMLLQANSVLPFSAGLLRVPGWQAPLFEVLCRGADRSTAHTVGTETAWVGYMNDNNVSAEVALAYDANENAAADTAVTGADGYEVSYWHGAGAATSFYNNVLLFTSNPTYAYAGACSIEYSADGGDWTALVGHQVVAAANNVRITNQVSRVTWTGNAANADASTFLFEGWDNSAGAWESQEFQVTAVGSTGGIVDSVDPHGLTILRNSPEVVAIKLSGSGVGSTYNHTDITLTLRRRQHWVEGYMTRSGPTAVQYGVKDSASSAGTNVGTYGSVRTSADANGNKWKVMSPDAITQHANNGIYLTAAGAEFSFFAGLDLNVGATHTDDQLYFAAMSHRQDIVSR